MLEALAASELAGAASGASIPSKRGSGARTRWRASRTRCSATSGRRAARRQRSAARPFAILRSGTSGSSTGSQYAHRVRAADGARHARGRRVAVPACPCSTATAGRCRPRSGIAPHWTLENLHRIDAALQRLRPPRWPEEVLGAIDRAKAEWGRRLFEQHCLRCHGPRRAAGAAREALDAPLRTANEPALGDDRDPARRRSARTRRRPWPSSAETVDLRPTGLTAADVRARVRARRSTSSVARLGLPRRRGRARLREDVDPSSPRAGGRPACDGTPACRRSTRHARRARHGARAAATALHAILTLARQHRYDESGLTPEQRACLDGFGALDLPAARRRRTRRGRSPASGRRAPYLHNGSVPTLLPAALAAATSATPRFFVSPGAFDPVTVGVDAAGRGRRLLVRHAAARELERRSRVPRRLRRGRSGEPAVRRHRSRAPRGGALGARRVPEDPRGPATLPGRLAPGLRCALRSRRWPAGAPVAFCGCSCSCSALASVGFYRALRDPWPAQQGVASCRRRGAGHGRGSWPRPSRSSTPRTRRAAVHAQRVREGPRLRARDASRSPSSSRGCGTACSRARADVRRVAPLLERRPRAPPRTRGATPTASRSR